jgi:hypothetical protein
MSIRLATVCLMTSTSGHVADPPRQLVVEWALCGIAAAASRFIPVPLVDDAVKDHATRYAVHRTLRAHGRTYDDEAVEELYEGVGTRGASIVRGLVSIPRRIALFPVRKYVAIFGSVRGVPNDVLRVVLLGRTVHRAIEQGRLDGDGEPLREDAIAVRRAYDDAIEYQDLRLLRGALADGLSQGRSLTRAAVAYARTQFAKDSEKPGMRPGGEVERSAEKVESVLRRPDVVEELEKFDARIDAVLATPRR